MDRYLVPTGVSLALLAAGAIAFAGSLSSADKQFLITAAKANMTEAHEGQMAEAHASAENVKEFGKTLDQDHTQAYQELAALAAKEGVSIPNGIDTGKDATVKQLSHLEGASFDRAFANDEIAAHRQAIALFKREAAHGADPDVKAYAAKMIPALEKHLSLAEQCAKPAKHA